MRTALDDIVITDGNREAYETILALTQDHDEPVKMFVYGPIGAGKSTIVQARGRTKDMLSKRKVMFCNAAELVLAVTLEEVSDEYLEKVGSADVLLIDGFEDFFKNLPTGPLLCRLLITERNKHGFDTVLFSDLPLSEFDLSALEGVLDDFVQVSVEPLDADGFVLLAHNVQATLREGKEDTAPLLADDALEYLARDYAEKGDDIRNALRYLIAVAGFEDGTVIDLATVKEAIPSRSR